MTLNLVTFWRQNWSAS